MRVGFCGAQRVGKTTLAKATCQNLALDNESLPFVETQTRSVFQRLGLSPKEQYPILKRLYIQQEILATLSQQWQENENAIFDRTPLDVLAYMEADVLRDFPADAEVQDAYFKYREACFEATRQFDTIILVQPGIPIVDDDSAAQGSLPYMEHFNTLCTGYLFELAHVRDYFHGAIIPRRVLDLDDRVYHVKGVILDVEVNRGDK